MAQLTGVLTTFNQSPTADYQDFKKRGLSVYRPTPASPVSEIALSAGLKALERLNTLEPKWNGREALLPQKETIYCAKKWLCDLYQHINMANEYLRVVASLHTPHVTAGVNGEVVLEWWHGEKKLTVYVTSESVEYLKVWGDDIGSEMEDGDAAPVAPALWRWLTT